MSKPRILVTGAAGKTAAFVVEQLLERGFPVRAFVRRNDERSARLKGLGAEVAQGDFHQLSSVRAAMAGVERVYFCYPPAEGLLEATSNVATAARDEGVEAVVNLSQVTARENAASRLSRQHWLGEQIFDWAGVGASHVQPGYFSDNFYMLNGENIAKDGKIYLPYGQGRHAPVVASDIARVVVAILEDPTPHVGARHIITGPSNMTIAEMADVFSTELGKPVQYVDLPLNDWRRALIERARMPEFLADHLAQVAKEHQDQGGIFDVQTDAVENLAGVRPQSLAEFIRENRDKFTAGAKRAA